MSGSPSRAPATEGPDFIGVGVPKAGTTWLARCLAEHPGVYFTTKEIAYFTRYFHRGYGWYHSHFREKGSRIAGEITPSYFITPRESPWRKEFYPGINPRREVLFWRRRPSVRDEVRARYPGIKVFVVLRDPADRAWSYYWHWRGRKDKLGKKVVPFEKMFQDDGRWIRSTGYYADWVEKWRAAFPDFGVFLHDDLKTDPDGLLREVLTFLGVDGRFKPSFEGAPNPGRYEPLPAATRRALVEEYRPQVEKLSRLIGRDLSGWLRA
jgi:sulfotransferase family protein